MTGIIDRLRTMQGMGDIQLKALMDGVGPQAADEIERLAARLEATEEDRARLLVEMGRLCAQCDALRLRIKAAEKERDALRAKIKQMEKQEPVGEIRRANSTGNYINPVVWVPMAVGAKLYAGPGAKGEEK